MRAHGIGGSTGESEEPRCHCVGPTRWLDTYTLVYARAFPPLWNGTALLLHLAAPPWGGVVGLRVMGRVVVAGPTTSLHGFFHLLEKKTINAVSENTPILATGDGPQGGISYLRKPRDSLERRVRSPNMKSAVFCLWPPGMLGLSSVVTCRRRGGGGGGPGRCWVLLGFAKKK